jgi:hypothetical protein
MTLMCAIPGLCCLVAILDIGQVNGLLWIFRGNQGLV